MNDALLVQVWELEASLDAKKAVCDRLERQLQLSANQMQRQHDVEERYGEAQRRLRSAESSVQDLQAELQVRLLLPQQSAERVLDDLKEDSDVGYGRGPAFGRPRPV